jgi:ribosome-associated protein
MSDIDTDPDDTGEDLPPSKSARKRAAHAAQKLGERLVKMRAQDLVGLPLDDELRAAITEAKRLTSRAALARQHQYIGKLMRGADIAALEAALAAREDAQKARARLRQ